MEDLLVNKKRARDDSDESGLDSPEVKRLRDDLLCILDESDPCAATQELDSVMKSFAEEISASASASPAQAPPVVDLTSDSGESQPELGYLLEASDDELGLPPSVSSSRQEVKKDEADFAQVSCDDSGFGGLWGFGDEIPSYDMYEFGIGGEGNVNNNGEYLALEGLFDYSDMGFGSSEYSDSSWRSETLPAL